MSHSWHTSQQNMKALNSGEWLKMAPIDVREISPANRIMRAHRLCCLKESVASHRYTVNPLLIAQGLMLEAWIDAASQKRAERSNNSTSSS